MWLAGLVLLDLVTLLATLNSYHPTPGNSNGGTVTSLGQVLGWVAVIVLTGLAVIIATTTLARSIGQRRVRRTYRQLLKDAPELR